ncbi:MAG: FprA family A-type flavoprotein, partial [bacterium]
MHCTRKLTNDILWVGADDRRTALFENAYPIPRGVSYNSYLILDEKTALLDTIDRSCSEVFLENVAYGLQGRPLDYLVIHHMEPDHSATLLQLLDKHPETTVVANKKIVDMIAQFFGVDLSARALLMGEGGKLPLGRHELTFVNAPMVHWPEVMLSYDAADKILFSADAFGTFGALDGALFADELDFDRDYLDDARRYYVNIVGKYGTQVQAVLKKASKLDIQMLAPLHGPVWRKDLGYFLTKYDLWSRYEPEEAGVCLVYGSVYGGTENMANCLAVKLRERGVKAAVYDASKTHVSELTAAAFRFSKLCVCASSYNAGVFTPVEFFLTELALHNFQNRPVALLQNGSWTPTALNAMKKQLEGM